MDIKKFQEIGKISKTIPKDSLEANEYINQIKKNKEPNQYYVQYNTQFVKDGYKLNVYVKESTNQLALEYHIPESDKKKERIILATAKTKVGNIKAVEKIFEEMLINSALYTNSEKIVSEKYIQRIQQAQWEPTDEAIKIMRLTKESGNIELQRKEFTTSELEKITQEEENRIEHNKRREQQIIDDIEQEIIRMYKMMPLDIPDEIKEKRKKVLEFANRRKNGIEGKEILDGIFESIKPIQNSLATPAIEKIYISELRKYIDAVPIPFQNEVVSENIDTYLDIRKMGIQEKNENVKQNELPKGSTTIYELYKFIEQIDKKIEKKDRKVKESIMQKVERDNKREDQR